MKILSKPFGVLEGVLDIETLIILSNKTPTTPSNGKALGCCPDFGCTSNSPC